MSLDSLPESSDVVLSVEDLLAYFREAEKLPEQWRVGVEHEKIAVCGPDHGPVPYEGPRGIRELMRRVERFGYRPFYEHANPIAAQRDEQWISLEPGGQLELSGRPERGARAVAAENQRHFGRLRALGEELGITFLGIGYRPFGRVDQMPWMPKRRYELMRAYLPEQGGLAKDMMQMTASVQASFDFGGEEDCAAKVRAAGSVSSLVAAIFANSPIVDGRPSGLQSFRSRVWEDVDPARCGLLPFFFDEQGFTYRRYVEWALDVPMLFIRRGGIYRAMGGMTFRQFLRDGAGGERATQVDFADHLSTLFPEVRIKRVIEVRSADAGGLEVSNALPALYRGLLYDPDAREAATALTSGMGLLERETLQHEVAREGMRACLPGGEVEVRGLCREVVAIAARGLRAQGWVEDVPLLDPLVEIVETGRTGADRLLEVYSTGDRDELVRECAIR